MEAPTWEPRGPRLRYDSATGDMLVDVTGDESEVEVKETDTPRRMWLVELRCEELGIPNSLIEAAKELADRWVGLDEDDASVRDATE